MEQRERRGRGERMNFRDRISEGNAGMRRREREKEEDGVLEAAAS